MTKIILPLVVITLFFSFFRLGSVTLFDVDEAVFAEATKEMVASGDWITPTYNGENRYDKPILFYWLMAASYKIFGISEFSARFPSALAAFVLVISLFLFVRYFRNEKTALYAALSLILSIYFLVYSHAAVTDMLLTLFISLSLMSFYLSTAQKKSSQKTKRYIYGFYFFSALAFLTKGLIGILFPFGIAFLYLLSTDGPQGIKKMISGKGIAVFIIVSAPWYVIQTAINGKEFLIQFFIKHHFTRYTDVISGHRGPVYYYILVLIIGLLPWIAFLPAGIKIGLKKKDKLSLFALLWAAFIIMFFSFSTTKLPNYVLPSVPALTLLISSGMTAKGKWTRYAYMLNSLTAVVGGIGIIISKKYLASFGIGDIEWTTVAAVILLAAAVANFYAFFSGKKFLGIISAITASFLLLLALRAFPLVNQYLQGTLHKYSLLARERLQDGERIITSGINNPSIVFYSGHRTASVGSEGELASLMKRERRLLLISKADEIDDLKNLGFNLLEGDGRYAILERK